MGNGRVSQVIHVGGTDTNTLFLIPGHLLISGSTQLCAEAFCNITVTVKG